MQVSKVMFTIYHSDLSFVLFMEIPCVFLEVFSFEVELVAADGLFEWRRNSGSFV